MEKIQILKEINKGAKTGIDGLNYIIPKVQDLHFKDILSDQKSEYENIYDRSKAILTQNNEYSQDTSTIQKAMSWMGIELNTLTDISNSKLAQILIQGNDMGIIKGTKLLNNLTFEDSQIENLLKDFINLQQENIEGLKKFL